MPESRSTSSNKLTRALSMMLGFCGPKVRCLFGGLLTALIVLNLTLFPRTASHFVKASPFLIVSFDGFRWDYLSRTATPNFDHIIKTGVYAHKGLSNVFTTSTLTNHWSIVTGLYAESHGIVENDMYDPILNKTYVPLYRDKYARNDPGFYDTGVEPIWVSNQLQKAHGRSGSIMWWGAENVIKSTRPTHHMPFDYETDYRFRIDTIIKWFTSEYPINLGLLYFNEPDHTAHKCGPDSENVTKLIEYADELTGYLFDKLKEKHLFGHINVIITSDHGFTSTSRERLIHLDKFVDPSLFRVVHYTPVLSLIPNDGQEKIVYKKLKDASATNNFRVYYKKDIPERLHYKNHRRVTPIVAIADLGYSFISNMPDDQFKAGGNHGYDNQELAMHPFFMASGPAFKSGFQVETFESVDLYPLMCHLLDLQPAPNNGSMAVVSLLLKEEHETTFITLATYLVSLVIIATFGGVFAVGACRNRRYLKRTARPINVSEILGGNNGAHIGLLSGDEEDEF
ncbi:ectonucleotide pyrophosphatase/phosphodiesterase family member 5-like [Elysia marginata]|uniref:Ectonucleotide pyrophosphatase/phosphodiesterase family member 5-like n=1 Tax=Elysia marginata TaxID=1093978 RepID=A0AAV4IQH3_9GAST|nr:ectonucleotide pyrophosphatase/phosphodiesterase family member 5-like [Elysia marginata]